MHLGTRQMVISVDGEDVSFDVTNCRIAARNSDSDFVSFGDARSGGGKEFYLAFTAAQDPAVDSLWDLMWSHSGETVPVILKPAGGTTASASQPHFTGNVTISTPEGDLLGGEANQSTSAKFTWEGEWVYSEKPTRVTA